MNWRDALPRILIVVACGLAIYLLQSGRLGASGVVLAISLAIVIGRGRAKADPSGGGKGQDLTWRPVVVIFLRSLLCFAGAIACAAIIGVAIKERWLPDNNWTGYGLLLPPLLGLFALGMLLLGKAIIRAQLGSRR
jgi:hypothetical protein